VTGGPVGVADGPARGIQIRCLGAIAGRFQRRANVLVASKTRAVELNGKV
jgi:hypothetical protein